MAPPACALINNPIDCAWAVCVYVCFRRVNVQQEEQLRFSPAATATEPVSSPATVQQTCFLIGTHQSKQFDSQAMALTKGTVASSRGVDRFLFSLSLSVSYVMGARAPTSFAARTTDLLALLLALGCIGCASFFPQSRTYFIPKI